MVILTDDLRAIAEELVRGGFLHRVHIGLDYFDASINRVAAWVIGTRAMLKALLVALLEPIEPTAATGASRRLHRPPGPAGRTQDPAQGAVWDYYCQKAGVPVGMAWLDDVRKYEADVLSQRR